MGEAIIKILAVSKDKKLLLSIQNSFQDEKYEVVTASSDGGAIEAAQSSDIALIITDQKVSGVSGVTIIEAVREANPAVAAIIVLDTKSKKAKEIVDAFADGRLDYYITRPVSEKELLRYAELALQSAAGQAGSAAEDGSPQGAEVAELRKELEEAKAKLAAYAKKIGILTLTDVDTKLYNRKYFFDRINSEFNRSLRYNTNISVIAMNIDNFKKINEHFGTELGDSVIRQIGALLKNIKRNVDVAARFGGVEFAVLLPEIGLDGAKVVAERFRQAIDALHITAEGSTVKMTASFGVACFPAPDINSPEDLLSKASEALQHAVDIGRNRVVIQSQDGLVAIGEGETITVDEKARIKKSILDFMTSHLNLEDMCSHLLSELGRYFARDHKPFYGAFYVVQKTGTIDLIGSTGKLAIPLDAENLARNAAYSCMASITKHGDPHHPFSTMPITGTGRSVQRQALAVLNINKVPKDMEFFNDLLDSISLAVRDAVIRQDIEELTRVIRGM